MEYSRAALKQEVKRDLKNTQPGAHIVALVYMVVVLLLTTVVEIGELPLLAVVGQLKTNLLWIIEEVSDGFVNERELVAALGGMDLLGGVTKITLFGALFGFISSAVTWIMDYGFQGYCLHVVRHRNPGFTRLLCAFPKLGWVVLTGLLISVFMALWAVLICFIGLLVTVAVMLFASDMVLAKVLLLVVWVLLFVWLLSIALSYSMANYILLDEKVDSLEAIGRSKDMMRGRKRHLLVLYLSFAGLVLLAAVVAGVVGLIAGLILPDTAGGSLAADTLSKLFAIPVMMWVNPYITGSVAKFYNWMKYTDIAHGVWEGTYPKRRPQPRPAAKAEAPVKVPEAAPIPKCEEPVPEARPDAPERSPVPEQPAETPQIAGDRPDYE